MKIPAQGIVGREALREAAAQPDLRAIMDLVRAAIDTKVNAGAPRESRKWVDVEAFYADRMVVNFDGRCWSYPYTVDGTTVTLGEPQEVVETYAAVKESAPVLLVEADGAGGTVWEASLICAGLSLNGVHYTDALLRESVPLFEGARIFVKGDVEHLKGAGKDVRQLVGWVERPRFIEGASLDTGRIAATIQLPGLPEETRNLFVEAAKAGRTDLVGLSIDAAGAAKREKRGDKTVRVATRISKVNSVDLIVEPGAGGGLVRLVEAADPNHLEDSEMTLKQRMLEAILAANPTKAATIDINTVTDAELETAYREAVAAPAQAAAGGQGSFATLDDLRMIEARANARVKIAESTLPAAAKDKLRADFDARTRFAEADIDAAIKGEREYLARFTESGHVRMGGIGGDITVEDRAQKMAGMLDAFFDPAHKDHRAVGSFKECYIEFTGDRYVTGRLADCDRTRLREASANFREALDSTSWADALGNSITRRMQAVFTGETDLQAWRRVAVVGRTNDFRPQERARVGGYGNLPIVAQGDAYGALTSPGDDKATYTPAKRGGTESVTREMILNDDVNAVSRIPIELALAAGNTLYEFVFDFFRTNPTIYDGVALYHANHGNLFAAALSATEFSAHRLAMLKQTRAGSAKRLSAAPAFALVPFDQEEKAFDLFHRDTNLDPTFVQSLKPQVIAVSYWTDTNDWCTVADPKRLPVVEIGFVNGQEEPELFVQDAPNVGSMFSNDKLTYKIRHEYGGDILVDGEKGTTKAVVA